MNICRLQGIGWGGFVHLFHMSEDEAYNFPFTLKE